jgi:NADH-quinone oxidoreductase subunit L
LESSYSLSPYLFTIAVVIAVMTAFYTFRMVGLVFFGKPSKNMTTMESKGQRIHEVSKIMWIPFAILAISSIAIGVVGFAFEAQIHSLFAHYLSNTFGISERGVVSPTETQTSNTEPSEGSESGEGDGGGFLGLNPIAAISSVGAFGVGGFLGYLFYIQRKADPEKIQENVVSRAIWQFLHNRWYLNSLLYWIGVVIPLAFYRLTYKYFEGIFINGINPALQYSMVFMSKVVKVTQTGNIQTYLYVFSAGIIVIAMLLLM